MDIPQLIDAILGILSSEKDAPATAVQTYNDQLREVLAEVNKRLRRCDKLLREGHRTQAIEACEVAPNLLDLVAQVDFPELDVWRDYVEQFSLEAPPVPLRDIAAELNEAYSAQLSQEGLLDQLRLHSLARSPLSTRLKIVKQLASRDPNNLLWQQDLQAYEKARLGEIKGEAERAAAATDVPALALLEREITQPDWAITCPPRLVEFVVGQHASTRARVARAQLTELSGKLMKAFGSFDIAEGQRLRGRWNSFAAVAGLPPHDPLVERASPALRWLDEADRTAASERAYKQAVMDLDTAIDTNVGRLQLEQLYRNVTKHERELPSTLTHRYQSRLDYLEVASRRKFKVLLTSVVLLFAAAAVGVTVLVRSSLAAQELSSRIAILKTHLQDGDLTAAKQDVDACLASAPKTALEPSYQALIAELKSAEEAEAGRKNELRAFLDSAEEKGLSRPDWAAIESAEGELEKAIAIAQTSEERAEVKRLQRQIGKERQQMQSAVDDKFEADVRNVVERMGRADPADVELFKTLQDEAAALIARERVSQPLKVGLELHSKKLDGMLRAAGAILDDETRFRAFTDSVGDVRKFTGLMEGYLAAYPPPQRRNSDAFQSTLQEERSIWGAVNSWNSLISQWRPEVASDPARAARFASDMEKFRKSNPAFPQSPEMTDAYLGAKLVGQRVTAAGEPVQAELMRTFRTPLFDRLYAIRRKPGGTTFFCKNPPEFSNGRYTFDYFHDLTLDRTKKEQILEEFYEASPGTSLDQLWRAPQWQVAEQVIAVLEKISAETWDRNFCQMLGFVEERTDLHPVVRLRMYRSLLRSATATSLRLHKEWEEASKAVETQLSANSGNWIDPEDAAGRTTTAKAADFLKKMPALRTKAILADLSAGTPTPRRPAGVQFEWIGWLVRTHRDTWECRVRQPFEQKDQGDLLVFLAPSASEWKIQRIGQLDHGRIALSDDPAAGHRAGRPVYLVRPSGEPVAGEANGNSSLADARSPEPGWESR